MKAAPQPSLFQRMGKPCLAGCLTVGVHRTLTAGRLAQLVRAPALQAGGPEFESRTAHQCFQRLNRTPSLSSKPLSTQMST